MRSRCRKVKRELFEALAREKSAGIGRLAAEAARSLGCGEAGMEAAEAVIRHPRTPDASRLTSPTS
jgi:hypothetical protein